MSKHRLLWNIDTRAGADHQHRVMGWLVPMYAMSRRNSVQMPQATATQASILGGEAVSIRREGPSKYPH